MIGVLLRVRSCWLQYPLSLVFTLAFAIAVLAATSVPSQANPRYAAIVYDVNSGEVLFARNADARRYPASITKVMTLYLVFEELEAGRLSLDTPMKVSQHAANQVPSKVGVRPGSTITVKDAIGVLVTKSANDVAVVVAEHIEGSVSAFAERMTRTARSIGMANTTYRNPHGLPNSEQVTTARDIVKLALAVQRRFPQYYGFFNTRHYSYAGTRYRNHNRLLGQMAGVDGLKTGFIRASGFNLVSNLKRDGKHLVGVVLGGRTGATRDAHMREILSDALPRAQSGGIRVANAPLPPTRPRDENRLSPAAQHAHALLVPSTVVPATVVTASTGSSRQQPVRANNQMPEPAPAEEVGSTDDAATTASEPGRAGDYAIQVGAFDSEGIAKKMLSRASDSAPDMLNGVSSYTQSVESNGSTLWRARFAGFDQSEAEAACAALKAADFGCYALRD